MTFSEIVKKLSSYGSTEPEAEALILLNEYFGMTRQDTVLFPGNDYSGEKLTYALSRRSTGEPIQYIIGRVYFYGNEFKVTENTLIPRPDTEILCEAVIDRLPQSAYFLELCTGSGCIPVSILKARNDAKAKAIELYKKTAAVAIDNRELNQIDPDRLEIVCADALKLSVDENAGKFDAIVSNPPYIRSEIISTLSKEVSFEPPAALDGGKDGLIFYRKFLADYRSFLKDGGFFAFEIGFDQARDIKNLAISHSYSSVEIIKNYSGNDRVAIIKP